MGNIQLLKSASINFYDHVHTFYSTDIKDNGKLEATANFLLQPSRVLLISGRRVEINKESYNPIPERLNSLSSFIQSDSIVDRFMFVVICICFVVGTVLKIIAWIFIAGVYQKNRHFIHLQKKPLKECYPLHGEILKRMSYIENSTKFQSVFVPDLILETIAHEIRAGKDGKKNLGSFSLASKGCYRKAYVVQEYKNKGKINSLFPSFLVDSTNSIMPLMVCSQTRLLAHRISDDKNNLRIKKMYSKNESDLNFLPFKKMGSHLVKWGKDPVPFIALQTQYTYLNQSFMNRCVISIASRLGLKKNPLKNHKGVILIYQTTINEQSSQWSVKFPWQKKSFYISFPKNNEPPLSNQPALMNELFKLEKKDLQSLIPVNHPLLKPFG